MTCLWRAGLAWTVLCSTALAGDFPANLKLVNLHEPSGFRLDGVAAQDFSGASIPGGGDVNGDGGADFEVLLKNIDRVSRLTAADFKL